MPILRSVVILRNAYIGLVIGLGVLCLGHGILTWTTPDLARYLSWCIVSLVAAGMKVRLPSGLGTMSMNFLFVLIAISEFGLGEALLMGALGALVQCLFQAKVRPKPVQVAFSISSVVCSIWLAYAVQHAPRFQSGVLTAAVYFLANTLSVSLVIALTERKNVVRVWRDSYFWSFPNYLVGAAAAWVVGFAGRTIGWEAGLLLMPILYVVHRSHNMYVSRLREEKERSEQQRAHAEEVADLHRRTIETLAIAIEAKDQTTHDHLERVEIYAMEVAKDLGLPEVEMEALRAAALLHDIGKIAVPEYIIAKPGKLTPAEFEKMKTHTVVGAELVERIRFPYPVAPMVRGHHEKWNGTGYPDGLVGEHIPIGARILAAVDCLDALTSDRQYRRAMPLSEAIAVVQSEAGKSFDPAVVDVLVRRAVEIEGMAKRGRRIGRLSTEVVVTRGEAPAAGFEKTGDRAREGVSHPHASEYATGRSTPELAAFMKGISKCRDRAAAFDLLRSSLGSMIPCETMVVYLRRGELLLPECITGDDSRFFASLIVPLGAGLSGWVAENGKAIINGNPAVEPGYPGDSTTFSMLRSALAVPLTTVDGIAGVISLYRREYEAFNREHLATLTSMGSALASVLELTSGRDRNEHLEEACAHVR